MIYVLYFTSRRTMIYVVYSRSRRTIIYVVYSGLGELSSMLCTLGLG